MAGFQIRVVPDALRGAADRFIGVLNVAGEAQDRVDSLIARLNEAWDGPASMKALQNFRELHSHTGDLYDGAKGLATKLQQIAETFETVDGGRPSIMQFVTVVERLQGLGAAARLLAGIENIFGGSLRIVPDEVRSVAQECKQLSDSLASAAGEVNDIRADLANGWEGKSYDRFSNEADELRSAYKQYANALDQFADTIMVAANRYEELDNSL